MSDAILQYAIYLVMLVGISIPLGAYMGKVMNGERTFLSRLLAPCENLTYRMLGIRSDEQMNWKKYALSVVLFSVIGLAFLWLLQMF